MLAGDEPAAIFQLSQSVARAGSRLKLSVRVLITAPQRSLSPSPHMNAVFVSPIAHSDLDDVAHFEISNRVFFESSINARPAMFYAEGGVHDAIAQAIRDASEGRAYQFVVRIQAGSMVGRVNLTRVRREHFHSAELGYRVGQPHLGKGYATKAVLEVLRIAFVELQLKRIEACASVENTSSLKVLLRTGFTQYGRSTRSFELAGRWHDVLHFERHSETHSRGAS